MTEWNKTYVFLGVAAVSVGLAAASSVATRPAAIGGFEKVGQPFFPDFEDPLAADSLSIVTYNDETSVIKNFDVARGEDGLYRISPYDYPADADDRLAEVATSLVGVVRGQLASRRASDYERYGVIDPLTEDSSVLTGRGSRVTVKDETGAVLADYILGGEAEGADGYRYVRRPDEKEVYRAELDVDLSSRFTDWVEADVLDITAGDVRRVLVKDYQVDEEQGRILQRDNVLLTREGSSGDWVLEGLDEAAEEVDNSAINDLVRNLNDLSILGVRPKPEGIRADLSIDPAVIDNTLQGQMLLRGLQVDMAEKGFIIAGTAEGGAELLGTNGQLSIGTEDGVAFDVYFGELFSGNEYEIEGLSREDEAEGGDADTAEGDGTAEDGPDASLTESRYIFVAARVEPALLGEPPVAPVEPPPVEESAEEPAEADEPAEAAADPESDAETPEPADAASPESPDAGGEEPPEETPQEVYERELAAYETARTEYESKVADADEAVAELNDRYGAWYYVVSAEDFKEVRLSREAVVTPVVAEPDADGPAADAGAATTPPSL